MMRLPALPLIDEMLTRPDRIGLARLWRLAVYDPAVTDEFVEMKFRLVGVPWSQR